MRGCTGNGDAAWPIRQVHPHRLTGRYGFSKDGVGDIKRSERLGGLADRGRKPESARETAEQGCARTGWCKARWGQSRGFRNRSEEHTSELQSLMRISYAVFCLKKKKIHKRQETDIKQLK